MSVATIDVGGDDIKDPKVEIRALIEAEAAPGRRTVSPAGRRDMGR
jgi:hypothetical protein